MALVKQGRWVTGSGQGVSSAVELGTETLVGFYTPGTLDAAKLKLQASQDGQTFVDVSENGNTVTVAVGPNRYVSLDAAKLLGTSYIRIVHLDAAGIQINEGAERVLRPVFRTFE